MKSALSLLIGLAISFCLSVGSAQAAEPVAMVTDLSGDAWIQGQKQDRLSILSYIEQGGIVRLDAKSSITITTFSPAAEYSISGPAKLELAGGEVRVLNGGTLVKLTLDEQKASAGRQFSALQRERLAMAALRMRGAAVDGFGLDQISPVNVEILNVRPVFTWSAPREAERFIVELVDETEGKTVTEVMVNEPIWKMPSDLSLQYQHQYSWQVRAVLASGQEMTTMAEFSTVNEAQSRRIMQNKPPANAPFSDRVLYAVLLESEGLDLDAADEWRLLAAERPNERLIAVHLKKN